MNATSATKALAAPDMASERWSSNIDDSSDERMDAVTPPCSDVGVARIESRMEVLPDMMEPRVLNIAMRAGGRLLPVYTAKMVAHLIVACARVVPRLHEQKRETFVGFATRGKSARGMVAFGDGPGCAVEGAFTALRASVNVGHL